MTAPARLLGGYGSGKTTTLLELARRMPAGRGLLIVRHAAAVAHCERAGVPATTFVDLAVDLVARHSRRRRLLTATEQHAAVAALIDEAGAQAWPSLPGAPDDPAFSAEVAHALRRYQASFLGAEELRTHAQAAGQLQRWDDLLWFADRYRAELAQQDATDDTGAVVEASLLLRRPEVRHAERDRFDLVLVDDFEAADFAANRLLGQLAGPGGPVVVSGNPDGPVDGAEGQSPRHLLDFARRFSTPDQPVADVRLEERHRRPASPRLHLCDHPAEEPAVVAEAVAAARSSGAAWSEIAVLVPHATSPSAAAVAGHLHAEGLPAPVLPFGDSAGRSWRHVVVAGVGDGLVPGPRPAHRWFDLALLGGPDTPTEGERTARWVDEERRRFVCACNRPTDGLLVTVPPPPSPLLGHLPV